MSICTAFYVAQDTQRCAEFAERLIKVSTRYELPATHAVGSFMLAAADGLQGSVVSAVEKMEPLLEATFGYGFFGMLPGVIMADALARCDRDEAALTFVARLLEESRTPEVGVFVPELWRIRGELVIKRSASDLQEGQRYLEKAMRMAQQQNAPIYRLRAGVPLASLLAENGRSEEAMRVIDCIGPNVPEEWTGPETAAYSRISAELGANR
jgi:hypothetical protein